MSEDCPEAAVSPSAAAGFRPRYLLVHYGEIALKGKNRRSFEDALIRSLKRALVGLGVASAQRLYGRLLLEFRDDVPEIEAAARLRRLYGVSHFEPAARCALDLDRVEELAWEAVRGRRPASFAVVTQRSNKAFPVGSMEVNRRLGRFLVERTGWKVSLDAPELALRVYLLEKHAYVAVARIPGPGGLPVGIAGKVACLLSGGIDSPVAADRILRRGALPVFIHFHSAPFTSGASQEKVKELARLLMRFHPPTRLYMMPFGDLQRRIVTDAPPALRVIIYRRFMVRAAEALARREGALALATGENLSQVASQTLANLATIDAAASMPILRPVIGMDKQEIIREAEAIGSFEISIAPHEDCCSFLMPPRPATQSTPAQLERAERGFDVAKEVEALVAGAEAIVIGGES
jgi:thiamine biosynthesis protein ThiI